MRSVVDMINSGGETFKFLYLRQAIVWALNKPEKIVKREGMTISEQQKAQEKEEKEWGNKMIRQENNGQWTTKLGENLVFEILKLKGEKPRRAKKMNGFIPDWETDEAIYEVKTSNWCVGGTAGEKVLGTWLKYQDIPELYGKPLKIICIANQEWELTHGKTVFFGEKITDKTRSALHLAKSWDIEYVPFSKWII